MRLSVVTAPSSEPLTTAEAKLHLRVDVTDDDALIGSLITSARTYCENFTHRSFMPQTWDVFYECFPCDVLWLPIPPVSSITSVKYYDTSGNLTTWDSANYLTELPAGVFSGPARITPIYNGFFPATRRQMSAVQVRIVCGYTNAAAVPDQIKAAMKLLVSHWYNNREAVVMERATPIDVPMAVEALLWPFKVFGATP